MAIRTLEEVLASLKTNVGDNTSDSAISLIEDVTDTINDLSAKANANESEKWKKQYEENDTMWRQKYRDRFFNQKIDEEEPPQNVPPKADKPDKPKHYSDLFKVEQNSAH